MHIVLHDRFYTNRSARAAKFEQMSGTNETKTSLRAANDFMACYESL